MTAPADTLTLNTGAKIPTVGFGTYESPDEETYKGVVEAIKLGYRHVDTASFYGNEAAVGKAIRDSGIPREEIFVTTKAWITEYFDLEGALDASLKRLNLDYVDLYLMHFPVVKKPSPDGSHTGVENDTDLDYIGVWEKFQQLPKSKTKAVGISNFTTNKLQKLLDSPTTKTVPAVNQVELHPWLAQQKLVDFNKSHNIVTEAYAPLARGRMDDPVIQSIAEKHKTSPAQILLSWGRQRGYVILAKSVNPDRIKANLEYVELDKDDLAKIEPLKKDIYRTIKAKGMADDLYEGEADSK